MHKQLFIFICSIFLLIGISKSARIAYANDDDDDELNFQYRQQPSVRSFTGNALYTHELIDNNMLDDELYYPVNRRTSYNLYDFFKRGTAFTTAQIQFQKEMLAAHNAYRKSHCVPALVLDDQLSRQAQDYADKLIATDTFAHSHTSGVGENLWAISTTGKLGTITGNTPTDSWYSEIKYYDFTKPGSASNTGHFTQLVWKNSQKLGAAISYNSARTKAISVAQYAPPGNVIGAFPQNVLQPKC